MSTRRSRLHTSLPVAVIFFSLCVIQSHAQQSRRAASPVPGGERAVVVDERLSALRDQPTLSARLLQRMSRGRVVTIAGSRRSAEGIMFYRVATADGDAGWVQGDALVSATREGEDARLLRLVRNSYEFDRLARARIFLDLFPRSPLRPAVLMLYGEAAEKAADELTREAARRLDVPAAAEGGAPVMSYYLNYNGLDRYNRQGVTFHFDAAKKQYRYDGAAWREIVRRYPQSTEAAEARKRLESLAALTAR